MTMSTNAVPTADQYRRVEAMLSRSSRRDGGCRPLDRRHLGGETAIDEPSESASKERGQPEEPQLRERPSADEQRGSGAARRIHGGVGHRNANQVDQCEY